METTQCEIVRDLLPLYIDDVCSEESRQLVEEHLSSCSGCKEEYELLTTGLSIPEEHDTSAIKRIRHRIFIEKIMIGLLIILILTYAAILGFLKVANSYQSMNDLLTSDMVAIEEDEDGNLWLLRRGTATEASVTAANQYTPDGQVISDFLGLTLNTDIDSSHVVVRVELCTSPFNHFTQKLLGGVSIMKEERNILVNVKEKTNIDQVIIITPDAPEGVVLWSRNDENP